MEEDVADVGGIADDREDDVGLGSNGERGRGPVGAHVEEGLGFGLGAGEDSEGVAGLEKVGAHGLAHYAGSDPAQTGVGWGDWLRNGGGGHGAAEMASD